MSRPRNHRVLNRAVSSAVAGIYRRVKALASRESSAPEVRLEPLETRVLMARVEGIDVSQWQGTVDWAQVHDAGKEFAFIRATRGNDLVDPKLAQNTTNGWAAGMLLGVYHFALPDTSVNDAVNEANWFLSNAKQYMRPGWMRPVIDVESGSGLGKTALSQWVNDFSNTIENATGAKPIIYTNGNYAKDYLDTSVMDHELWLARYNSGTIDSQVDQPQTPTGYPNPYGVWNVPVGSTTPSHDSWSFWQYTNQGTVAGITENVVDLNVFQGERALLESQFVIPQPAGSFQGVAVNFGKYETPIPSGYINFADQTFTSVFGYNMGWNDVGARLETRNSSYAPDQRYQTYVMPNDYGGLSRSFEIEVPSGSYRVRIVAGSPTEVGNTHQFWAESVSVVNAVSNSINRFVSGVQTVQVTDGRLTISSDSATAPYSRLTFLDVVPADRAGELPQAPTGATAMPASSTSIDVRWTDNADNEGRDPSTFSSSTWAQVNEGYRVERRDWNGSSWSSWSVRGHARANAELYHDTGLTAGAQYQYRVAAVNAAGQSAATVAAAVTTPTTTSQQSYTLTGDPWPIPALIQAEDFDRGGQGVSYNDISDGNAGGFYRDGGGDVGRIGTAPAGTPLKPREHRLAWMRPTEWIEYTVNVPSAGTYAMHFRVAVPGTGAKFHATTTPQGGGTETNLAGPNATDQWDVPDTGDWDAFTTVTKIVELSAGVQVIRVYADVKVTTNPGVMDFDWLRIAPRADLSVEGVDEAHEATDGRYVRLNANADEANRDLLGNPLLDNEPDATGGERVIGSDADLRNATLSIAVAGTWKLTFGDKIRVWRESALGSNSWIAVVSGQQTAVVGTDQQIALKIEGIAPSSTLNDTDVQLTVTPTTGTAITDTVKLTVSGVDLDIDSDNNGLYNLPSGSRTEERLEDDASAPGKIVYVNDNDNDGDGIVDNVDGYNRDENTSTTADNVAAGERFVPITFVARDPFDPSVATYQISYTGSDPRNDLGAGGPVGGLRLWSTSGDRPRNGFARLTNGIGDYIAPGAYSGSQLGLSTANRVLTLWLEAAAMPTNAYQPITITVDPDGTAGPAAVELLDTVNVTVKPSALEGAVISGFKWNDQNGDGIRNTVALQGNPPELVYVIDISGSTAAPLVGFENFDDLNNGDVNSDGKSYTRLDAELAGFIRLSQHFADPTRNYPTPPTVSIVLFGKSAASVDMQSAPDVQLSVPLTPSSLASVIQILSTVRIGSLPSQNINVGQSTNYVAALEEAHRLADSTALSPSTANVVFLSDGYPNPDNWSEYERSAESLRNAGFRVRAFGAGDEAQAGPLSLVDYYGTGKVFHTRDELVSAFADGAENYIEPPLQGWTIFADLNNNGALDTNEQQYSAVSDEEGNYAIIGLPAGTYTIREVLPNPVAGWTQTAPAGGSTQITVTAGQEVGGVHFGNRLAGAVDLDVDSDNTGDPPDRNPIEEDLEDDPVNGGKRLTVSTGDIDVDGKLDFNDFDGIVGNDFAKVVLDLSAIADPSLASIAFAYSGSDPAQATPTTPASGYLRLWLKDADQARSVAADYIRPGQAYSAASLQIDPVTKLATLYVEAVGIPTIDADRLIRTDVVTDTTAPTRVILSDSVYVQPQNHAPVFDAETAPPTELHINPYGPVTQAPPKTVWKNGDVFASLYSTGPNGTLRVYRYDKESRSYQVLRDYDAATLDAAGGIGGMAFDRRTGMLFGGGLPSNNVARIAPDGTPLPKLDGSFGAPECIVFDAVGDMYVGNTGKLGAGRVGIYKYDPAGNLIDQFVPGEQVDFADLAADQHTLLFTYEGPPDGAIYSLDTNTGQYFRVMDSAPTPEAYALRILPDGDVLVATGEEVIRVRSDFTKPESPSNPTTVVQTYDAPAISRWFAVNLDPDGKSFWSGSIDEPGLFKFDIATGELLTTIATEDGSSGITVYGERTAAIPVDQLYTYPFHATDEDLGDTVSYEILGDSHGATIDPVTGVLLWTPRDVGNFTFSIRAKDQRGTFDPQNDHIFTVSVDHDVNGPNEDPAIPEQTLGPAQVGRWYTSKIVATDADNDGLTYSLLDAPDMLIDPELGVLRWLPTTTETPRTFTVSVDDGRGGTAQRTFAVNVLPSAQNNRVPSIAPNAEDLTATSGQTFAYTVQGSDPDGDSLRYIAVDMPLGMELNRNSGQATWLPGFDQLGDQDFTIGVTDFKGGYAERTFTVSVNPGIVPITGIDVQPAYVDPENKVVDPTAKILVAQISNPAFAYGATFSWTVTQKPSASTPDPEIIPLNEAGDVVGVIFAEAGNYKFSVSATNAAGTSTFTQADAFTIEAVAKRIIAAPSSLSATTGQTITPLTATVYDQFGKAMTADVMWRFLTNGSQGSLTQVNGIWTYTAGSNANKLDILQVSAASPGADPVTDELPVEVTAQPELVGAASGGFLVTEGEDVTYSGVHDTYGELGGFYDPLATASTDPNSYTATIYWGDGSTSPGTVVRATVPGVPAPISDKLFAVNGTHRYNQEDTYDFTIDITAPGGRTLTIAAELGTGITVQSAKLTAEAVPVTVQTWQPFDGVVATFDDPSPTSEASEFGVEIDWGDGVVSAGTVVATATAGHYEIRGTHTYAQVGAAAAAVVRIFEVDDADTTPNNTPPLRFVAPLKINTSAIQLPTPTGVQAVAVSTSQIEIKFDLDDRYVYLIKRLNPDGTTTTLPPEENGSQPGANSPYYDQQLPVNTRYGYQVVAADQWGNFSDASPILFESTWSLASAPVGVSAQALSGSLVRLTWTDGRTTDQFISGWDIFRAEGTGSTPPAQTEFVSLLGDGEIITSPTFDDDTVEPDTQYWYQIVAVKHREERSQPSTPVNVTTLHFAGVPLAPTNLQAGYAGQASATSGGPGRVGLTWDAVQNASLLGYDVYRGTTAEFPLNASTLIGSSPDPFYVDDVTPGTTCFYAVRAVSVGKDGGEISSAPSNVASVNTSSPPSAAPTAPTSLRATDITIDHVDLTWVDQSRTETEFDIYRRDQGTSTWSLIGRVTAGVTTFTDTSVLPSASYEYKVAAHNQVGDGDSSPPVLVTTPSAGPAPDMPATLTNDVANTTDSQIALTWSAVTTPATVTVKGYYLYRRVAGAGQTWIRLSATPITGTSYVDRDLDRTLSYDYKVTAVSSVNSQSNPKQLDNVSTSIPAQVRPSATITAPAPFSGINVDFAGGATRDGRIQKVTQIKGIIDDPNVGGSGTDQVSWTLVLRPTGVGSNTKVGDVVVASGTGLRGVARNPDGTVKTPGGEVLASLDPSLYASGNYDLILTASDSTGPGVPSVIKISLYSQSKLGNLTLPIIDLSVDVPGGQPITVRRVYDSGRANELGDFGYGWQLELSGTDLRTTARAGTSTRGGGTTLRQGDVIYATLPSGEEHAFQFWPIPTNYSLAQGAGVNPYGIGYVAATYWIQFVCVDGSNAKLIVPGDINEPDADDRIYLTYDREHNEFFAPSNFTGLPLSYNPTRRDFGNEYQLSTVDGATYNINATTGSLRFSTDANGNRTDYNDDGPSSNGIHLKIERNGPAGTISRITLVDASGDEIGNPLLYTYDTNYSGGRPVANLLTVQDRAQRTTTYEYDSAPDRIHFLSKVTDNRGVVTLDATYNAAGLLESLTDHTGNLADVGIGTSDGSTAGHVVEDLTPQQNTTETIYDDHGNPTRVIESIKNSAGAITAYSVAVTTYNYFNAGISSEIFDLFDLAPSFEKKAGASNQNSLVSSTQYASFEVSGSDAAGLRYSNAPTQIISETTFDGLSYSGTGRNLPSSQTLFLDANVKRVTTFADYDQFGQPARITVTLQQPDPANPSNTLTTVVASTRSAHDDHGNVRYFFDSLGQGTENLYTDGTNGVPRGLLLKAYRVSGESALDDADPNTMPTRIDGDNKPLTENAYYTQTDVNNEIAGAYKGSLKYSVDAGGQKQYFAYDRAGNLVHSYRLWVNPDSAQPNRWVGTTNVYDGAGRLTNRYEATYLDDGDGVLDTALILADPPDEPTVSINETVYRTPAQTLSTQFNAGGQIASTADEYSGQTVNTYDGNGLVIQAAYPDGTVTRSVYDAMGRVILSLDRFKPGQVDPVQATRTIYDALGRAIETQRVSNVSVMITPVMGMSDVSRVTAVSGAGIVLIDSANPERGWKLDPAFSSYLSRIRTFYDEQGRVIEEIDAGGLRTGTIYTGDGRLKFAGILKDQDLVNNIAPDGGHVTINNGVETRAFLLSDLETYTAYDYDLRDASGKLYDRVTDALNQHTDIYNDLLGRVIKTVYHDGTSSQTLYGVNNLPVTGHVVSGQTITGRQETRVDQRGDATDYFYDLAGRLTDVWLPAVADAENGGAMTRPHWRYEYDSSGNQIVQVDPKNRRTEFTYDERNLRLTRTLPLGIQTPSNAGDFTEHSQYNDRGQQTLQVDFEGRVTEFIYNNSSIGQGRLQTTRFFSSETTYNNGGGTPEQTLSYSYDDLGRVQQTVDSLNGTWTYGYNPISGHVAKVVSPQGTVHHEHDAATGRLTRTYTGGDDPNRTSQAGDGNAATDQRYSYDNQGRLQAVSVYERNDTPLGTPETTTYFYDGVGNLDATVQSDGITTDYAYDDLNRLTTLEHFQDGDNDRVVDSGETSFGKFVYALNSDGTRGSATETDDQGNTSVFNWSYDAINRLIGEAYDGPGTANDYVTGYRFDLASNRLEKLTDSTSPNFTSILADGKIDPAEITTPDQTIDSSYDANDRLLAEINDSVGTSSDTYTIYGYGTSNVGTKETDKKVHNGLDATGTLIAQHSFSYNVQGQLAQAVVTKGGTTTTSTYAYDPRGMRIEQVVNDGTTTTTTKYLIDRSNPTGLPQTLEEKSASGSITTTYTVGLDVLTQHDGTNGALTLLYDGHGSTRALASSSHVVVQRFAYDAYGALLNGANLATRATALTNLLYSGEEMDRATGLQYLDDRYYNPSTGRFERLDPLQGDVHEPRSLHRYLYAYGNPILYHDPTGNVPFTVSETAESYTLGEFIEADAGVVAHSALVKATAVALSLGIVLGGGLVYTQNGSPTTILGQYQLQQQAQLRQRLATAGTAHKQAVDTAVAAGKGTRRRIQGLPIFWVYKTGPGATPEIWQNDFDAMAGSKTMGGAAAPNVLLYIPGINKTNRPAALAWAASVGITRTPGVTSLDEYPFASTFEGGAKPWLRVEPVKIPEQTQQRNDLNAFYTANTSPRFGSTFPFLVVLVP